MNALAALRRLLRPTSMPCPLCAGTARESLTYSGDELMSHALDHRDEDVWAWTREQADDPAVVEAVDGVYSDILALTTTLTPDDADYLTWSWMCLRCNANRDSFPTDEAALHDRLANHRCPTT